MNPECEPTFDLDDDDRMIEIRIAYFEGWILVPIEASLEETEMWARDHVANTAPRLRRRGADRIARHLVEAALAARESAIPGTWEIRMYQAEPDDAVLAILTVGLAPIELFPRSLDVEVRAFERRGTPVGRDERSTVTLPAGAAARVRNICSPDPGAGSTPADEAIQEGVTYLIQPPNPPDFRVVFRSWWNDLALGDELARHIDLMAQSLTVSVHTDPAAAG